MRGRPNPAPLLAVALGAALSGCVATRDFTVTETIQVDSPGTAFAAVVPIDLTTTGAAWSERSHVKKLEIRSVEATIVSRDAGDQASTASGTLALRPQGAPADGSADVTVLSFTAQPIQPGATFSGSVPAAANQILESALKGDGQLQVSGAGTTDAAPARFTVEVSILVHMEYTVP